MGAGQRPARRLRYRPGDDSRGRVSRLGQLGRGLRDRAGRVSPERCARAQRSPVISVDTKQKDLVGDFKNAGREWQPTGEPERVRVHDFPDDAVGKAIPYGVYDMARNEAWVSVGRDHDTPAFAVASIRQWWTMMGRHAYPAADALYLTADAGGSNGYRRCCTNPHWPARGPPTGSSPADAV